jgi:hypothetical protein
MLPSHNCLHRSRVNLPSLQRVRNSAEESHANKHHNTPVHGFGVDWGLARPEGPEEGCIIIVSQSGSRSGGGGGGGRKEMVDAREAVAMERTRLERRKCRGLDIPGAATIYST